MSEFPLFDVCLNRHKSNPNSIAANLRTNKSEHIEKILNFIRSRGGKSYLKEIERGTGLLRNTISGRLADLKCSGVIVETGERKEGCGEVQIND
jgi:uncharacterized membrane protein